jgi:hypothetical protein
MWPFSDDDPICIRRAQEILKPATVTWFRACQTGESNPAKREKIKADFAGDG